ncbi:MAG: phosphoglycerate kinase [bacterium]
MKTLEAIDLKSKRVLVRCDFNVPVKDGKILDNTRILAHIPTINYILEKGASRVILMSHLGRPKGVVNPDFSLKVVCEELRRHLKRNVRFFNDCTGENVREGISRLEEGAVALLENLRFHPEEKKNDAGFAREIASLGDVFIQDAFAVSHRAHASTVGIAGILPSAAGFLIMKEVKYLSELLKEPGHPFVAVLGGAKISTKISVITSLLGKVDTLLVGGAMSYTFLKARGEEIGNSMFEEGFLENAKGILADSKNLVLPVDHVISKSAKEAVEIRVSGLIPEGFYGVDIGSKTISNYTGIIKNAKTIFWNGPMGIFEVADFSKGTREIAKIIAETTRNGAVSVAGGGDSVSAIKKAGVANDFSHISTGGGASLEFVEGRILPGIQALK